MTYSGKGILFEPSLIKNTLSTVGLQNAFSTFHFIKHIPWYFFALWNQKNVVRNGIAPSGPTDPLKWFSFPWSQEKDHFVSGSDATGSL